MNLDGKVVIVTGAGAGIGRGILRSTMAAGATAVGFDITDGGLDAIRTEGAPAVQSDVSDVDALITAINMVRYTHGRLDGLVSNAGVTLTAPFLEAELSMWETLWAVNHRSVLVGCQAAARIMAADGTHGSLVNIASNHAKASDRGFEAYAGTKGAIVSMTRAMAWSLGPNNIRANSLCPGLTLTEVVAEAAQNPETDAMFRSWHATAEVSTVDDIGQAAVFLLSDASVAMTGTEIVADRGMSSRLGKLGT